MTNPERDDLLTAQLGALSHDGDDVSLGFTSRVMRSIEEPARRSIWQRMLDSFSPTTPQRRRVAALALLPAGAAMLSFLAVLWLAKPSVASQDSEPVMTSDLLATGFSIYAPGAATVFLAGDFNGWAKNKLRLRDDDRNGTFGVVVYLPEGQHRYVFWVDGKRVLMPDGQKQTDSKRGAHSLRTVVPNRLRMSLPDSRKDAYASVLASLTKSLRNVPVAQVFDVSQCKNVPGVQVVNSRTAADELRVVHADGASLSSLRQAYSADSSELIVADGKRFSAGDRVLVSNAGNAKGAHLFNVAGVKQGAAGWSLQLASPSGCRLEAAYTAGALVVKADVARIFVKGSALMFHAGGSAKATRLASKIHDFQVALGVDTDRDGLLFDTHRGDDEWFYNSAADDAPVAGATPRAVRFTLVAHSAARGVLGLRQIEDHKLSASAATRLRVVSLTVALRNLENQP